MLRRADVGGRGINARKTSAKETTNKSNQIEHALTYVDFSYGDNLGCHTDTSLKGVTTRTMF